MDTTTKIHAAAEYILSRTSLRPTIGLVLGSGLGDFADTLEDTLRIPFSPLPPAHRPRSYRRCGHRTKGRPGRSRSPGSHPLL